MQQRNYPMGGASFRNCYFIRASKWQAVEASCDCVSTVKLESTCYGAFVIRRNINEHLRLRFVSPPRDDRVTGVQEEIEE